MKPHGDLKSTPTGGSAEQASKHRARDAEETADLRFQTSGLPRCREISRSVGPPGPRCPAPPRTYPERSATRDDRRTRRLTNNTGCGALAFLNREIGHVQWRSNRRASLAPRNGERVLRELASKAGEGRCRSSCMPPLTRLATPLRYARSLPSGRPSAGPVGRAGHPLPASRGEGSKREALALQ